MQRLESISSNLALMLLAALVARTGHAVALHALDMARDRELFIWRDEETGSYRLETRITPRDDNDQDTK